MEESFVAASVPEKEEDRSLKILVLAPDAICKGAVKDFKTAKYSVRFLCSDCGEEFDQYDGVVVFQDVFERVIRSMGWFDSFERIECDKDALDRRYKESEKLIQKGGFVLLVQTRPFYDRLGKENYNDTDLIKRFTNFQNVWRRDYPTSTPTVLAMKAELNDFCKTYGRAYSFLSMGSCRGVDFLPLVKAGNAYVGYSFKRSIYVIPSLPPRLEDCKKYFTTLIEPIIAIHRKRQIELPDWAKVPFFDDEQARISRIVAFENKIIHERRWLDAYAKCKRVLFSTGDELVKGVASMLSIVTGEMVDTTDEKKEDCRIIDKDGKVLALVEVKGVNGNLKLQHVTQAYQHRERTTGYGDLPVLLIANTCIASSMSMEEKDRPPPNEQVEQAEKHHVLILRTIDLLHLLRLYLAKQISQDAIIRSLLSRVGWWNVFDERRLVNAPTG